MSQDKPVLAWLHKEKSTAFVITNRVKEIWLACNPKHVENYTIPLYAAPQAQDAQTGEGKDGDLAITESLLDDGHASGSPDVAALIEYLREQTFRTRGKKAYMLQEAATAILALQHQLTHTRERLKEALDGWVSSEHEAESELFLGRIEAIRKEEGL